MKAASILAALFVSALLLAAAAPRADAAASLCNGPANGVIDGDEECEGGACCTAKCELAAAQLVCRTSLGPCDPAETCGEQSPAAMAACPANVVIPDGSACNDGSACTTGEFCSNGACGGAADACDDENECTKDSCNQSSGECSHQNTNNNRPCEDGDYCTVDEVCNAGECLGVQRDCDDANVCTDDACNENGDTCENVPNDDPCEDGLFCTTDTCAGGTCSSHVVNDCDDDNACTDDSCSEETAGCLNVNNTAPCEDGSFCTTGDACAGGACVSGPALVCTDNNDCTDDSCNEATDACQFVNSTQSCDDGLFCTVGDACTAGQCTGSARDCSDPNVCTTDSCDEDANACLNAFNTAACEDGDFCTDNDTCAAGSCTPGAAKTCDDDDTCTDDSCDEVGNTCVNAPNSSTECDDGLFCTTGDACVAGSCTGTPRLCADNNDCTTDSCDDEADACVNAFNTVACDDGLFCTTNDHCADGSCTGPSLVCDDNNDCTSDTCNELENECQEVDNTEPCDDGVFCNGEDTCAGGTCSVHPGDPCDGPDGDADCTETCDEAADDCEGADAEESACSDGNACTVGDTCEEGVCVPGDVEQDCTTTTTQPVTTTMEPVTTTTVPVTTTSEPVTTTIEPVTTTTLDDGPLCGDANGSGSVTSSDAQIILQVAVGLAQQCSPSVCDYNGSGGITSIDALLTLRDAVDLPTDPNCPGTTLAAAVSQGCTAS